MQLLRMFSNDKYKGTADYIKSQRIYELTRTILYFAISISLFLAGWFTTGSKMNLLTVISVLGCLPASKSLVETIIFFRFHGLPKEDVPAFMEASKGLNSLYDLAFTSYERNFEILHMVLKGNMIIGYTNQKKFDEKAFNKHLEDRLKADHIMHVTIKIFTDKDKYFDRISSLKEVTPEKDLSAEIITTIKNITL